MTIIYFAALMLQYDSVDTSMHSCYPQGWHRRKKKKAIFLNNEVLSAVHQGRHFACVSMHGAAYLTCTHL